MNLLIYLSIILLVFILRAYYREQQDVLNYESKSVKSYKLSKCRIEFLIQFDLSIFSQPSMNGIETPLLWYSL